MQKEEQAEYAFAATGSAASWEWIFGDGGTATGQNVSHVYAIGGGFTASQ